MSSLNPSDTALLVAMALDALGPAKVAYKAVRAIHNGSRDLLDALDTLSGSAARFTSSTARKAKR